MSNLGANSAPFDVGRKPGSFTCSRGELVGHKQRGNRGAPNE